MNVDRRWWGTSVVRVRILVAGLVLLGAGCAVLGWGTRFGKTVRNRAGAPGASVVGLEPNAENCKPGRIPSWLGCRLSSSRIWGRPVWIPPTPAPDS